MFTLQMKHLQQSNNPLNIKFMRKFVKLLSSDGKTFFIRKEDVITVCEHNKSFIVETAEIEVGVVKINDMFIECSDDIMCIIDPVE